MQLTSSKTEAKKKCPAQPPAQVLTVKAHKISGQMSRGEMIKCYHFWYQRYLVATQTALGTKF